MKNLLKDKGFYVIAAANFIGEHSFSYKIATGRPDEKDMEFVKIVSDNIVNKIALIKSGDDLKNIKVAGNFPYKERGRIPSVSLKTNNKCITCMVCAENCPTGAINKEDPVQTDSDKCIICC